MSKAHIQAMTIGRNISEFASTPPVKVYSPDSVPAVIRAIQDARECRTSVRSISTGLNWGLGSSSSPEPNCALLSLAGMANIREINTEAGYAIIEPGVTQRQLCEALSCSGRILNCTASSPETSILGNMMDRGVGLRSQRVSDLLGLELVLGSGETGQIGWWPSETNKGMNPHGLGPCLLQLFPQNNVAVATAGVVRLLPAPENSKLFSFSVPEHAMDDLIAFLERCYSDQLISGVAKVYDDGSNSIYGSSRNQLTAHLAVEGPSAVVEAKLLCLHDMLSQLPAEAIMTEESDDDALRQAISRLHRGDVGLNEDIVASALGTSTPDADMDGSGWIMCLPFIPLNSVELTAARKIVRDVCAEHDLDFGTTINALNHDVVDLVICLRFTRRNETKIDRAHQALAVLTARLVGKGFRPYRLPTAQTSRDLASLNPFEIRLARAVSRALDPECVFAETRYLK